MAVVVARLAERWRARALTATLAMRCHGGVTGMRDGAGDRQRAWQPWYDQYGSSEMAPLFEARVGQAGEPWRDCEHSASVSHHWHFDDMASAPRHAHWRHGR